MTLPVKVETVLFVERQKARDESPDSVFSENSSENETGPSSSSMKYEKITGECSATKNIITENIITAGDFALKGTTDNDLAPIIVASRDSPAKTKPKHKRSKSLTNSFQRFLRREKRLSSLDGGGENGISNENIRQGEPDAKAGSLSTPKMSLGMRRSADDENAEVNTKVTRKKSSKLKGFFRTISLNNIVESKRNAALAGDRLCSKCGENKGLPRKVLSFERFNSLKDERDMFKSERDRAVEEWSHAASRWEQMLDDMDSMMSELVQVRCTDIFYTICVKHRH